MILMLGLLLAATATVPDAEIKTATDALVPEVVSVPAVGKAEGGVVALAHTMVPLQGGDPVAVSHQGIARQTETVVAVIGRSLQAVPVVYLVRISAYQVVESSLIPTDPVFPNGPQNPVRIGRPPPQDQG